MSLALFRSLARSAQHRAFPKPTALLLSKACWSPSECYQVQPHRDGFLRSSDQFHQGPKRFYTNNKWVGNPAVAEEVSDLEGSDVSAGDDFLSIQNPRWEEAGLTPDMINLLSRRGIETFTPVQGEAFEPIVQGRDVIGRSRTGTGKTLAFGLPSMIRLVEIALQKGTRFPNGQMAPRRLPSMVVLCPTRELARQVSDELSAFAKLLNLRVAVFHGGVSYNPQIEALHAGLDILVGTPGRVADHISSGQLNLSECNIAVLDEADEMLSMGFSEQVEQMLKVMGTANREKTQTLLFSATTPDWVEQMARQYQKDAFTIDATGAEGGARVATTVRHVAVRVNSDRDMYSMLENIIRIQLTKHQEMNEELGLGESKSKKGPLGRAIIFTNTKKEADALVMTGVFSTLKAASIHGDHSQFQRDKTLDSFRNGGFDILVATDVAARGIDVKDVDLVVQLGPPNTTDAYVHRSGRTGRAGRAGLSLVIYLNHDKRNLVYIERELGHDFRFEITHPPTSEEMLALSTEASLKKLREVSTYDIASYTETAKKILEKTEDQVELVARCLAALTPKPNITMPVTEQKPTHGNNKNDGRKRDFGRGRPHHGHQHSHHGGYNSRSGGGFGRNNTYGRGSSYGGRGRDSPNRYNSRSRFDFSD